MAMIVRPPFIKPLITVSTDEILECETFHDSLASLYVPISTYPRLQSRLSDLNKDSSAPALSIKTNVFARVAPCELFQNCSIFIKRMNFLYYRNYFKLCSFGLHASWCNSKNILLLIFLYITRAK